MRIIHGEGYSIADRRQHKELLHQNVFMIIQQLIRAMDTLQISYDDPSAEVFFISVQWFSWILDMDIGYHFDIKFSDSLQFLKKWTITGPYQCEHFSFIYVWTHFFNRRIYKNSRYNNKSSILFRYTKSNYLWSYC